MEFIGLCTSIIIETFTLEDEINQLTPLPHLVTRSNLNQYLKFILSGSDADGDQITISFIDIQNATAALVTSLCGSGIHHQSR